MALARLSIRKQCGPLFSRHCPTQCNCSHLSPARHLRLIRRHHRQLTMVSQRMSRLAGARLIVGLIFSAFKDKCCGANHVVMLAQFSLPFSSGTSPLGEMPSVSEVASLGLVSASTGEDPLSFYHGYGVLCTGVGYR